ncbi:MFS transporter [Actinoplanes hulinensis]|uniref:MFS transporter n=2 Tax=Actinoplanes hulinensis TaxID=1144547 RepID=A0ABS7B9M6_9ACTN|nr:MFS transporter [Actinoplanes hulinensis]MBW6437632.1 MFS transporter [Actinoplanes hulinensis]
MPLLPTLGRTVGTGIKAARLLVRGSVRGGAWATRRVGSARARGAANEIGMIRLFDLHAVSCAGDALIAIGLAGTIFSVPLGEARSKVGLYLLITMIPFALLAPIVGPLLDHFRHGRRYALAATFLGRAFLAYVMSDNLLEWGLYPAAFGVLALSRAYGVARSAAVPRLLPEGVGLSQVGARASVYGTFAGILVAPIGLLAFKFGPQWPLRVATLIFLIGMVVSLRLPPRADSDPPEELPRAWHTVLRMGRGGDRPLSGPLVVATLIGSSSLRLLYGFLLLFLTFAIMGGQLTTSVLGVELARGAAVGLVGAALAIGTFVSTAAGTGLRIRRPLALQSSGLIVTAGVAVLTTIFYNLATVTLLALLTAIFSGIAKLTVDASIQERVPERQRATAFAHSETALMLAWVAGGGLGIIPFDGRLGIGFAALLAVLAAARAAWSAARLHNERLAGRPDALPLDPDAEPDQDVTGPTPGTRRTTGPLRSSHGADPDTTDLDDLWTSTTIDPEPTSGSRPIPPGPGGDPARRTTAKAPRAAGPTSRTRKVAAATPTPRRPSDTPAPRRPADTGSGDTERLDPPAGRRWWGGKRKSTATGPAREPDGAARPTARTKSHDWDDLADDEPTTRDPAAPPGFHVYRPSSAPRDDPES